MQTITRNLIIKHTLMFATFSVTLLLMGCKGDEGPMGPAGRDGIDGKNANTNVHSVIYDIAPGSWTGNVDGFSTAVSVPEITSDIYNNGAVLVYKLINESDPINKSFNMLPYTAVDGTQITYLDFDVFLGEIDLYIKWIDNGINDTQAPTATESYKVVIIEGIPLATLKKNVDVTNYVAVSKYLKINESKVIVK
jgi:hypothetical protein